MEKPAAHPFDDSNIALLGSDIDHHLRAFSASKEPAFQAPGIGSSPGEWIWRVEDFKLVAWPKKRYSPQGTGEFCEGDSYLVLNSVKTSDKDGKGELIHQIFFWLGSKTSQDEAGVAAYKTVELDELLGGTATQYREIQGSESPQFLHLFKPHFLTLHGGVNSGFHHVAPSQSEHQPPRLFSLVPAAAHSHAYKLSQIPISPNLSHSGVYLADSGDNLVQWNGRSSSPMAKAKGAEVGRWWVDEREGRCHLIVVEDDQVGGDVAFWKLLGVDIASISLQEKEALTPVESTTYKVISLKADGTYEEVSIPPGGEVSSALDNTLIYVITPVDPKSGKATWVWIGSQASQESKRSGMSVAQKTLAKLEGLGGAKRIIKVAEGHEGKEFWKEVGK